MIKGTEPIFPQIDSDLEFADVNNEKQWSRTYNHTEGISIRNYFAAKALQGLMSVENKGTGDWSDLVKTAARISVQAADALIEALNK